MREDLDGARPRDGEEGLLSEQEVGLLLQMSLGDRRELDHSTWIDAFSEVMERYSGNPAVVTRGGVLTYRDLDRFADQIAAGLARDGVGRGEIVPVISAASPLLTAAWIGIMRAGAAFATIDPEYPAQRIEEMIASCGSRKALTHASVVSYLDLSTDINADIEADLVAQSGRAPEENDLAYVVFTSGSTGKPKGVLVEHHSLLNYAQGALEAYGMSAADRVLQFNSPSFDFCFGEIFPALLAGATVVLRDSRYLDGGAQSFWHACSSDGISVMMLPSSFWGSLASRIVDARDQVPACVRLISIGGERAEPSLVRRWLETVPAVQLINGYGPTEAAVEAAQCDLTRLGGSGWSEVPIGRPMPHVRVYVLQPDTLILAPLGAIGELAIGGEGVARGYLGESASHNDSFVFLPVNGDRVYRTGDRVRWLPSGDLEYLGRLDGQVKIRGYRVELSEIESALIQFPEVDEAAAGILEKANGTTGLLACVAVSSTTGGEQLRQKLERVLPRYMVPDVVVVVEALPRAPSGKVDRAALSKAVPARSDRKVDSPPPSGAEARLADIWARVLGVSKVETNDSFFVLGGDSLMCISVVSEALSEGLDITLDQMFSARTLHDLALVAHLVDDSQDG